MLSRTLKMAFWVTYDHLGKLILANLIWFLTSLIPGMVGFTALMSGDPRIALVIGFPALLLTFGVVLPIATVGLAYMVKELIDTRDGSVTDMFRGMRLYGRRSVGVGFAYLAALTSLAVSVWFYAAKLQDTAPWLGYTVSALALWCLIFVGLTSLLVMPALVQKRTTVAATLKLTALLVLDNPVFCIGLAIQFLVLAGLSILPPVLVFFSGSLGVVLGSSAYEMLARKYAAARQAAPVTGVQGNLGRITVKPAFDRDDEDDDYLNRGFRDFLFPWKE